MYRSKACLIAKAEPFDNEKAALVERLLVRMQGCRSSARMQIHHASRPKAKLAEITKLLPGAEHPTILPLAGINRSCRAPHGEPRKPFLGNDGGAQSARRKLNPRSAD